MKFTTEGCTMNQRLSAFEQYLRKEEKSENTIAKYMRDVRGFLVFLAGQSICKQAVMSYKEHLTTRYAPASVNSMLIAVNRFLRFCGLETCCVRLLKIQRQIYCPEEKELTRAEYIRLCRTAAQNRNKRLNLILQTICGTGMRVSELQYITVNAVKCGKAVIFLKGKTRTVFLVRELQKKLLRYAAEQGIQSGCIFVTKTGKPISRTNIWREMKTLCAEANVNPKKVFPHNLRHLFARIFYGLEKDIAKLADILGHSSIDTTRLYIISTGAEHRRKLEHMRLIL